MIDFYLNETESELKKLFSEKKALYPDKLFPLWSIRSFRPGRESDLTLCCCRQSFAVSIVRK